ncbi:lysine-specific permease [Neobacillus bataviensis LMG 21833]|uniref:Lysine-specific permease n=1 Tax=Neobacillus bataviensis LMG 21833 TaxID=1117379 RepID=K6E9D7_9BACI|nr:amino acid permease [Neobacillus bataviensis]EKN69956.1 lysine-specific permease [Neobacillus bataviensis LMG 21833]
MEKPIQPLELSVTDSSKHHLKRDLKFRHLIMIALGGTIGTGLFLTTGATIHTAGPGGALLAYLIIGVMIYFIMTSLGEMASFMPISGMVGTYGTRFVDPAFGFALGWIYWYGASITLPAELSAATLIMKFWFPNSPSLLWSGIFLVLIFAINYLSVKGYGEGEYWFSFIKVATVIIFIILGFLMIFGIMGGEAVGFKNFTVGDAPFHGGFLTIFGVFLVAAYSFQGTEMVGIASGESENPQKNVPRAIKTIFWRILLFYVLAILVIGLLIPYTDDKLLSDNIMVSPFTLVFQRAGLAFAASVMNAVILTSVLSAGNSFLYGATRMLYSMALSKQAPRFLAKINKRGVPIYALLATTIFGSLAFLSELVGDGVIFYWLLNASAVIGFIIWIGISISHYRFRKAYIAQGLSLNDLPYRAKWFPFGPILSFIVCFVVMLGQGYQEFIGETIDWKSVIAIYLSFPLFIFIWLGYKFKKKTKIIPLQECDLNPEQN